MIIIPSCKYKNNSKQINTPIKTVENTEHDELSYCNRFNFKSKEIQADSLKKFHRATKATLKVKNKEELEKKFFCSFPNSFVEMQSLFGYDWDHSKSGPLYSLPKYKEIIPFFRDLNSIPKDIFYEKYINICINGYWEGDQIRIAFGIARRIENDTQAICSELLKRTDQEISGVFRFIFDGPHPKNEYNEKLYNSLLIKLENVNGRLATILEKAYMDIISQKTH